MNLILWALCWAEAFRRLNADKVKEGKSFTWQKCCFALVILTSIAISTCGLMRLASEFRTDPFSSMIYRLAPTKKCKVALSSSVSAFCFSLLLVGHLFSLSCLFFLLFWAVADLQVIAGKPEHILAPVAVICVLFFCVTELPQLIIQLLFGKPVRHCSCPGAVWCFCY